MYLEYFGLSQFPFSATPDTHFLLELSSSRTLFKEFILQLNEPDGFIKIIAQPGLGKTILCRKLLNALHCHTSRYIVIHIAHPRLDETGLLLAIAHELQIGNPSPSILEDTIIQEMISLVTSGKRIILVVDEAQAMPAETLEKLELLSRPSVDERLLMQVALFAQPLFNTVLEADPRLGATRERVTASYELQAISEPDLSLYISTRLQRAGYAGDALFTDKALSHLNRASGGVPRLINLLAHKSLMAAYEARERPIDTPHVRAAINYTEATEAIPSPGPSGWLDRLRGRTA